MATLTDRERAKYRLSELVKKNARIDDLEGQLADRDKRIAELWALVDRLIKAR